jgi:2-oxoglutarate dehydrogenase E1 component
VIKVHVAEGDTVEVGALLAEISPGGEGRSNGASSENGPSGTAHDAGSATETPAEQIAPAADGQDAQGAGAAIEITMPAMGESVTEGVVLEWLKAPGDAVEADETIVEISTDKVDAEVPSPAAGTMGEILAEAGETVAVGQVIARMSRRRGRRAHVRERRERRHCGTPSARTAGRLPAVDRTSRTARASPPVARRAAAALGVDLASVAPSSPSGRISKADVLAAQDGSAGANGAAAPVTAPAGSSTLIKGASAMLARYMDESRSIPTATSFRTLAVTTLDGRRKQLKERGTVPPSRT